MNLKRMIVAVCAALLLVGNLSSAKPASAEAENTMTAMELAAEMKLGWNLGNTFDASGGETAYRLWTEG